MRTLLRWIGRKLGVRTWYHVSATYPLSGGGSATMSCTLSVRPWLHSDNFSELVDFMKTQASYKNETPAIVSITRLGV
jgi:hypothetical protein